MLARDRERLRELARLQRDIAHSDEMQKTTALWQAHNSFRGSRPMIRVELWTFGDELIPERMRCEGEEARAIERDFLYTLIPYMVYHDDQVVPPHFAVTRDIWFRIFDVDIRTERSRDSAGREIGHRFEQVIHDFEEDVPLLGPSAWGYEREKTLHRIEVCAETFGDILPVKLVGSSLGATPTQDVVHLMGMKDMLFATMDYPEAFRAFMERIADEYIAFFEWLHAEGLLLPTTADEHLAQGSYCFTDELPGAELGRPFDTTDIWGYMDSQESVGISPAMFAELIWPAYRRLAARFGLLSYGCCEPVHSIWDSCLTTLEHLRKVSISPWCDQRFMGERLAGRHTIFHRKPSPIYLGTGTTLDEEGLTAHIEETLAAAIGCTLEFSQRDVYTINHDPGKARRYVEILRETIDRRWRG
ncbi:MAG: hypothetical protein QM270_08620 [Bacillota bacterium]|nr:hypothetical protein [Bacillota bacterium]